MKPKAATIRRKRYAPTKRELAIFFVRWAFNSNSDYRKAALMAARDLIDLSRAREKDLDAS